MTESEEYEIVDYESFEDLDLKDNLLRGIFGYGFEKPSAIQKRAIKPFIDGNDVLAQAQSGTGKTATFTISLLQSIDESLKQSQGIILSHTKELAIQICDFVGNISKYMNVSCCLSTGGISVNQNMENLFKNPQIIVGTPGRIMDMINKRALEIKYIKYVIIDEADEMLSLGFVDQIKTIFNSLVSNNLQVGLYSATMPTEFFKISDRILRNPVKILVKKEELTLEGIKQFYVNVERIEHKFEVICDLYSNISINQSIIYCNSKKTVVELARRLNMNNFSVTAIHSDLTHSERVGIIKDFREGKSRILLSTDLLSRGIDVQQVSIVLNYDIPYIIESYIHRIGRSGRFGRKGVAINIITYQDIRKLHDIEKFYGTQIEELPENFSTYL